jgi:cell division septum initiation protein DivIVA
MSQNLESILAAAQQLPPEELRQLIDLLLSDVSSELQADDQLRKEILEAEQQISRGDVVPWSEIKRQHKL